MEGIAACMTKNSFGWKFVVGFIVGVTLLLNQRLAARHQSSKIHPSSSQSPIRGPR